MVVYHLIYLSSGTEMSELIVLFCYKILLKSTYKEFLF